MTDRRAAARARFSVLPIDHASGDQSHVILDGEDGPLHRRADLWLRQFRTGTQRTYAYHLVDHLRWLAGRDRSEEAVTLDELRRYMALCGTEHPGPVGTPK